MAQVVEDREKSTHHMSNFPRDLLNRFMSVNHHHHQNQLQHHHHDGDDGDVEEEIELSLGLSMNGRFGVDPTAAKKIKRTTSIPEFVMNMNHPSLKDEDAGYPMPSMPCTSSLIRTCSLPTETEEEWRKRKELQTLRRLEARRKRSEKQRNLKALKEQQQRNRCGMSEEVVVGVEGSNNNSSNNLVEQGTGNNEFGGLGRTMSLSSRVGGLGLNGDKEKEKEKEKGGLPPPSPSRGSSIGSSSQGTGSSGISESESQQGSKLVDARSPIGPNSFPSCDRRSPAPSSGARIAENSTKIAAIAAMRNEPNKQSLPENKTKDIVRNLLEDMPSVSTKGDGPNGRRIEGFLYRYGKGEEVRIVCVCHGSFLTPAEFVKHAGGGDVANPLKHIVVSPSCL